MNNDPFSTDLLQKIDIITSVMNARPIKRVSRADTVFTLSPKELIMPLLSRANIRQNILHIGVQLCQDVSWSDYTEYKSDSQQLLQQQLLDFVYSESSWRYKILSKSNVSHDENVLTPKPQDIVAVKLDNGRDFKLGVVTDTTEAPRVRVQTLTNERQHEPLYHPLTLGLLFRDPPSQSSNEVEAENEARLRAETASRGLGRVTQPTKSQPRGANYQSFTK